MILEVIAASLTFTVTATGLQKDSPVEFVFAGRNTDRDYESLFLLDEPIDSLCSRMESCGLPRGKPVDVSEGRLWPVGCKLSFEPSLSQFLAGRMPAGLSDSDPIYTGGSRLPDGKCEANTNIPASAFSIYTLPQSPVVYNGIYDQGAVYGSFTAAKTMKKGERMSFTVSWNERTFPKALHVTFKPGNVQTVLNLLRKESENSDLDVLAGFDGRLTVAEATAAANALATIDSVRVKINGCTNIFYRSFLPLVKWRDRKERLVQPFELTLGDPDTLLFIEEDWTVEGDDPKLTPRKISFADIAKHPRTDTCFIFADQNTSISRIISAKDSLSKGNIKNLYVFSK